MDALPSYAELGGTPVASLRGALACVAAPVLAADHEHPVARDRALVAAVDEVLKAAAEDTLPDSDGGPLRWLPALVGRELTGFSTHFWGRAGFARIRLLERLGLVELEPDDTYVLAMVSALGPDKAQKLRADPALVERALWRVFEVEGGGEVSLTNVDRFGEGEWRATFLELTADGTLDRTRVLDACLRALSRDFAAYRAGWFSSTYLALVPSVEETARAQGAVRRLLGAEVPATVSFAVKQLDRLARAGLLDLEPTLEALPPATLVKARGTASAALALAARARIEHAASVRQVAETALGHPHPDVQLAAARLLADVGATEVVTAAVDDLAPGVREDLGLGNVVVPVHDASQPTAARSAVPTPVSRTDLAERVAVLLEDASDAMELEAVLAGLVADGAGDLLTPLRKRARAVVARGARTDLGDAWLPGQVARLVLTLTGDPAPPTLPDRAAQRFVVHRMAELRTSTAPLLATPDLPGGWVSAAVLVDRLRHQPRPRHHDLVAALLRLHPDGREPAARSARRVAAMPAAVMFALDGTEPRPGPGRQGPGAWWTAARRSRTPYAAEDTPRRSGTVRTFGWQEGGRERRSSYARFIVSAARTGDAVDDQPTELLAHGTDRELPGRPGGFLGDWIETLAAIWPHDAEHFLALTCRPVLESPNGGVAHDVPRVLDALARHPGRAGELAAATVAAGLSAESRQYRLHAVDALLDLVPGRVPVLAVADEMAQWAQAWPATRWADSLTAVARAPGGAPVVVDLLTRLLPQLPSNHRGLAALLGVLREEQIRSGRASTDAALLRWLHTLSGTSAAARTARLLHGGTSRP